MSDIDPNKNCHEYCFYRKQCRYAAGAVGQDPDECAMFYKIDDLMNEAKDMEREQLRAKFDEEDDW